MHRFDSECDTFQADHTSAVAVGPEFKEDSKWPYETVLEYYCPPGMAFKTANGGTSAVHTMTCNWNATWVETAELPDCICNYVGLINYACVRHVTKLHI